jgi:hypothetical protein
MEEKISSADSPAHLQADWCQPAEQYRQNGLGRSLLHLERKEVQQQKENEILYVCVCSTSEKQTQ